MVGELHCEGADAGGLHAWEYPTGRAKWRAVRERQLGGVFEKVRCTSREGGFIAFLSAMEGFLNLIPSNQPSSLSGEQEE